jgi:histidinol-phosphate phosphatase family protein
VTAETRVDVVIPTVGRESLARRLEAHAPQADRLGDVIVVDDRGGAATPLPIRAAPARLRVVCAEGRGPAAARNAGWRAASGDWIAFLDDDVVPPSEWAERLLGDLAGCGPSAGASQGRIIVPLPTDRRPTDWERNVAGLAAAHFATADMAYRRAALAATGGFDERFPRAYREDADLALRVIDAGWAVTRGERAVEHPVGQGRRFGSLRRQAGNFDDALMRLLARHLLTVAAGAGAVAALTSGRRRLAAALGVGWLALTADFARTRIAPGPRTADEAVDMLVTSAAIPPLAIYHRLRGELRWRSATRHRVEAVLFDRDGTLVEDVPYNGDPERVRLRPGAKEAVARLRDAGVPFAVVSNQSGIGRGLITAEQVAAVNRRIEELLGPIPVWAVCPHAPGERCDCRKPAPGLVLEAARRLRVAPERCAVIGDIGADVEAARAAGARAVLVPTPVTRAEEVAAAPEVARSLTDAVDRVLGTAA